MYTNLALTLVLLISIQSSHLLNTFRNSSFIIPTKLNYPSSVQVTRALNRPTKTCRTGSIVEFRGGPTFLVRLDTSNKTVLCDLSGRCIKRRIRVDIDTRVKVEFDLLYPSRGRIIERLSKAKKEKTRKVVDNEQSEEDDDYEEDDYYEEEEFEDQDL